MSPEPEPAVSFQPLAVVALGLVSPAGVSPSDHVFFVRAGLVQAMPSPFVDEDDERLPALHCPWIGADVSLSERLCLLAEQAAASARAALPPALASGRLELSLVLSPARSDWTEEGRAAVSSRLSAALRPERVASFDGAAGVFAALRAAGERLGANEADAVCIVGADSGFSAPAVLQAAERRKVPWIPLEPPPSEAAAALIVVRAADAERLPQLATVLGASTALGSSHDANDEVVDGRALGAALLACAGGSLLPAVFGPLESERLRRREWDLAQARLHEQLAAPHARADVETRIGQVGAASGAVHLAYAVACAAGRAVRRDLDPAATFCAWAISGDGTRGAALLRAEGS